MTKPRWVESPGLCALFVLWLLAAACGRPVAEPIVLATTTSVGNSGLLDVLLPPFERDVGLRVRVHLVGSGRALRMVEEGIADIAISHAPRLETALVGEHPDWFYRKLMFNDFVVVGPPADPAGVSGAGDATTAMRRIAERGARFVSRGDSSGTHERERMLWEAAAARPQAESFITSGQGMAATLRIASQMTAYTLTDRATFAQLAPAVELKILHEGDASLLNTYAVIVPQDNGRARRPEAAVFGRWLIERRARDIIGAHRVRGVPAFTVWPADRPAGAPGDIP
jgi:tungstate transport system substrate-binding protein